MIVKNVYSKTAQNIIFRIQTILLLTFITDPVSSSAQTYSGPFVITKGGTYSGNWESTDSEIPAVEVRTSEPVIIENSNIRGAGYLIKSWSYHCNLTVRHTNGYGITPTPYRNYKKPRLFLTIDNFKNLVVEHNYLEQTAGIEVATTYTGNGTPSETVRIRYNKVKNIDGRIYNGEQAYANFVGFNFRGAISHAEIAWNQVINEPNNSLVEDNINIFNSQGTAGSPIKIHNNYIQGAFPYPAYTNSYSGGGIITEAPSDASSATAHVEAFENHLVGLGNYAMGIAGGNNVRYHHNRIVNAAMFPDGTRYAMYTSGLWSKDYYNNGTSFNNSVDNNTVGVVAWNYEENRNDISTTEAASFTNNTPLPNPVSRQTEADEFSRWTQKLQQQGIVLGPSGTVNHTTPPVTEAPTPTEEAATDTIVGTGKIISELWANVNTENLSQLPFSQKPTSTRELSLFEALHDVGDNYGQRIRGFVTAPATGNYTFWIAGDNHAELWLSTSEDPAKKVKIAYINGWAHSREWEKEATQRSVPIALEKGKRYYIEAVHVEVEGSDNLAVGWQLPNGTMERPIAGNRLSPFSTETGTPVVSEPKVTEPSVYPNPFRNMVVLDMGSEQTTLKKVEILTLDGVLKYNVPTLELTDNKLEINLAKAKLNPGTYFLKYTDSAGTSKTIRIIKE